MKTAVLLLGFGEPASDRAEEVVPFLERIFLRNARLEMGDAAPRRARQLAERRAPGLIAEYRAIGGSPLHAQLAEQAERLSAALGPAAPETVVRVGMQFTEPSIPAAVESLRAEAVARIVAVPVYPITGPSTTIAALEDLGEALRAAGWAPPVTELLGWHRHPGYVRLRAEGVRRFCGERGLDPRAENTRLLLCAHGTPLAYLREGSRYAGYVREHRGDLGAALDAEPLLGFQNHANRPGVEWTQPEIGSVITGLDAERAVLVPISYMQEQSETLAGMDHELRAIVEACGIEYHRVPVPHDDPDFIALLAGLIAPLLRDDGTAGIPAGFRPCGCRAGARAVCPCPPACGVDPAPRGRRALSG